MQSIGGQGRAVCLAVLGAWIDTWLAPAFSAWTLDEDLRRVQCPVLVMHGSDDEYGSNLHPQRIAALVQGPSALELMQGCGHVPHRERIEAVLTRVRRQLAEKAVAD